MWRTFTVDGLSGHVRGDGVELALVLHGGPGLTDYTESLADEVGDGCGDSYRVARYQQRGQEPSAIEAELTVAEQVRDALTVLDHFGTARALVVGHSWGAHLAMHIAAAAPERVSALLLVDALGGIGDGGAGQMGAVIGARIGEAGLAAINELETLGLHPSEAAARQLSLMWPGYFKDPANAPPMPPIGMSPTVNAGVMTDAMRLLNEDALARALPPIDVPSLHMIGVHSPIDPEANRATAALMKNAIVVEYDTGHFIWIEEPGSVAKATGRLLAQQRAQTGEEEVGSA